MNASKKLRAVHVYIIGAVVALIFFVGLFFLLIRPVQAHNGELENQKSTKVQTRTFDPFLIKASAATRNPGRRNHRASRHPSRTRARQSLARVAP